jgi:hypothetical protein
VRSSVSISHCSLMACDQIGTDHPASKWGHLKVRWCDLKEIRAAPAPAVCWCSTGPTTAEREVAQVVGAAERNAGMPAAERGRGGSSRTG